MEKNSSNKRLKDKNFIFPANLLSAINTLDAKAQLLALKAICYYGARGETGDTGNALVNGLVLSAIIQIDAMLGREQRYENGLKDTPAKRGRRGNPAFIKGRTNPYYRDNSRSQLSLSKELKHNDLNKDNSKIIQSDNNLSINKLNKDNSEIIIDNSRDNSTPYNEMKHSELDNDNSPIRKKESKGELDNTSPLTELVLSNRGKEKEKEKSGTPAPAFSHGRAVVPSPLPGDVFEPSGARQSEAADSRAPQAQPQLPPPPSPSPERSGARLTEAEIARRKARMKASLDPELTANIHASYERGHAESEAAFMARLSGDCPEDTGRLGAAKPPETDKERMNALKKANDERILQLARMEEDLAERARILAVIGRKTL